MIAMARKMAPAIGVILLMLNLTGCFYEEAGDVIYLVSKTLGGDRKLEVPNMRTQAVLAQTVFRANRSSLDILNQKEEEKDFKLTRMAVGLELEFEFGIENVLKVENEATIELRFERLPAPHFVQQDLWDDSL